MSIIYVDTSALIKLYIEEAGHREFRALWQSADRVVSVLITRTEVAAAFAKTQRMNWLTPRQAQDGWESFLHDWEEMTLIDVSKNLVSRASDLAWQHGLRGYDSIHLSAALLWQELVGIPLTLATFDRNLWAAARKTGLTAWPDGLAGQV